MIVHRNSCKKERIQMKILSANACAKINIGLKILGELPNGYHEIETIFQSVDLCDKITVSPLREDIQIAADIPDVPLDETNICYKAAKLLKEFSGEKRGCRIHISKKIPMGAGLGGGSSDAATTLKILNRMWNLNLEKEELGKIARKLGADVPFFLSPGAAIAYGIGDELEHLKNSWDFFGVIIYPNRNISTEWAYKNIKIGLTNAKKYINLNGYFLKKLFLQELPLFFKNDFESVVFDLYPQFQEIKINLLKAGAAFASMSGSGSAFFGLFHKEKEALAAFTLFDSHPYQKFFVRPYRDLI